MAQIESRYVAFGLTGTLAAANAQYYGNCIRVLCPLVIGDAELDEALDVWEEALAATLD